MNPSNPDSITSFKNQSTVLSLIHPVKLPKPISISYGSRTSLCSTSQHNNFEGEGGWLVDDQNLQGHGVAAVVLRRQCCQPRTREHNSVFIQQSKVANAPLVTQSSKRLFMQPRLSCAHVLAIIWIHTDSYGTTSLNTSAVTISNRYIYIYKHITICIVIVCLSQLMVFSIMVRHAQTHFFGV